MTPADERTLYELVKHQRGDTAPREALSAMRALLWATWEAAPERERMMWLDMTDSNDGHYELTCLFLAKVKDVAAFRSAHDAAVGEFIERYGRALRYVPVVRELGDW